MKHLQKRKNKNEGMAYLFEDNDDPEVMLAQAMQEIVDLKSLVANLEVKVTDLITENTELKAENAQLRKDNLVVQGKLDHETQEHEVTRTALSLSEKDNDEKQIVIDEQCKRCEALEDRNDWLETERIQFIKKLHQAGPTGKDLSFTLTQISDYCKQRVDWSSARSIRNMLVFLLRFIGTAKDYEQVDSIEKEFKERMYQPRTVVNVTGDMVQEKKLNIEHNTGPMIENHGSLHTGLPNPPAEETP